jgi:hypothetical protein
MALLRLSPSAANSSLPATPGNSGTQDHPAQFLREPGLSPGWSEQQDSSVKRHRLEASGSRPLPHNTLNKIMDRSGWIIRAEYIRKNGSFQNVPARPKPGGWFQDDRPISGHSRFEDRQLRGVSKADPRESGRKRASKSTVADPVISTVPPVLRSRFRESP